MQEPAVESYQAVSVAAEPIHSISLPTHTPAPVPEQNIALSPISINAAPVASTPLPTSPVAHRTPTQPSTPTRQVLEQPQQQQAAVAVAPPANLTYADLLKQKKLAPLPSSPAPAAAPTPTAQRGTPHRDNHHHNSTVHTVADATAEVISFPTEHRAAAQQQPAATPAAVGSAVDKAIGGGKQPYSQSSNGNGHPAPRRAPREKLDSDLETHNQTHPAHSHSGPHSASTESASEPVIGVYLKNLPQESVNEQMLYDAFSQFGALKGGLAGISIVMSPRYLKVAYIKFEAVAGREAAMKASGMMLLGKAITVLAMLPEFCKAPGQGHGGGRGGRGSGGGGRGSDRFPGGYRNGGRGGFINSITLCRMNEMV